MMEKFVRVSDIGKEHAPVYTAEQIADSYRGVGEWLPWGQNVVCGKCHSISRDGGKFCKYCGARMENGR